MNEIERQLEAKIAELEQQKATIRQQEKFLRSIYDNVQEAIFVVDVTADGEFYYQGFNYAAKRLTGIEDVIGKTPAQLLPLEAATAVEKRYRKCVETAATISYEECLPFRGEDTWWLTTLNPIQDETGTINRIIGTSLNITKRKQTETELDRDKNFLQALLDNLSDGIVTCDRNGILTLFNQATREFHGLPQQAIPAEGWAEYYDLYLADGKTRMSPEEIPLFRALQGESVRDVEMMIIPKQGKPRIVLVNSDPIIDRHGSTIGAIAAMRDITDRRLAETELKKERVFIKALLNNLSDGIVACDENGILALFNQASQEFFGVPQEPLPPEECAEHYSLYYPDGKTYLKQEDIPLFRAFSGESFVNAELMAIPQEGKARTLLANGSPIVDAQGVKLGAVVVIRDITERKQTEQVLADLNQTLTKLNNELEQRVKKRTSQLEKVNTILFATTEQLRKSNQELEQFAYVTSHDLKAPLRAIANLSEWIEEDLADKLDDDTRYHMNLLRGRVHRLENLINGLLDYSRVGRLKHKPKLVAVGQMLAEIIDSLDVPADFTVEVRGEMPTFITEEIPLQQVFNNLIGNAIKHSDCDNGRITISVEELDDFYQFAVADNGKGIDPQYCDRIFTIFQTLEARDTKESTGIGLAIVKKAVENQGGKVWVESQIGAGATFRFTWKK
ncbi:PAS domain S-box [Hyella patelloides LEGE 07179]|uniref:histidine kinase n=1 Tax=Hyella patelloides LEGE 07179 TaxID=945734 RepID=A0A563VJM6_9CYAN|nr:PAS domain S-box protein [Hyella patelloides]VEP11602.1 PAS domain S-box [Hyella patelloides LEGE 07179]